MFDPEFYPTSKAAWEAMNVDCYGKIVLDPSAGKGDLLDYASAAGAETTIAVERHEKLRTFTSMRHRVIGQDWFQITSSEISHVDLILMNPPYSNAHKHILHAWKIAPEGCEIISQCNTETLANRWNKGRNELDRVIDSYGSREDVGKVYKSGAERNTDVDVSIVRLFKPVSAGNPAFDGFYYDMESENEIGGVVKYNEIQAMVNQYTGAVKVFDKFAAVGAELNRISMQSGFGTYGGFCFMTSSSGSDSQIVTREEFARRFQSHLWKQVFNKFNLEKFLTKGVMEDVNRFIESKQNYPFTMKNIFRMVEIIVGTADHNMNRAIVEAVDRFTKHTHENRYGVEGWKTNEGHLLAKKFITGWIAEKPWTSYSYLSIRDYNSNFGYISDLVKALCFITGTDFNAIAPIEDSSMDEEALREIQEFRAKEAARGSKFFKKALPYPKPEGYGHFQPNTWYEWSFFRFKIFKKGTGHFEFLDEDVWFRLNQAYGKAKGFPLPETIRKPKSKRSRSSEQA